RRKRMIKRAASIVLSAVLLSCMLFCAATAVSAANSEKTQEVPAAQLLTQNAPQIIVESKQTVCGESFTVSVTVKNNPGIAYLELTPTYSNEISLVSVENGELISDLTRGKQYIWVADKDVSDDGLLMTFTFSTAASIEPGSYYVGFIVRSCVNYDEQNIDISVANGVIEVRIADFILGDVNGDGKINGIDLNYLKRALSGSYNINAAMDINGDGKVNGTDVNLFKRFLAGSYIIE
ncbi:MAG: dockerin type I domain-containing protein, partial [Candidatus Avispirillum sp.]